MLQQLEEKYENQMDAVVRLYYIIGALIFFIAILCLIFCKSEKDTKKVGDYKIHKQKSESLKKLAQSTKLVKLALETP